jgi:ADP-dependent phosphofructokinase/glucokinase
LKSKFIGCKEIFLGGIVSDELGKLLSPKIQVPKRDSSGDSQHKYDEIHLIMEYEKGTTWENLKSPRANRFIVVRDIPNGQIQSLEPFHQSLSEFQPNLVVISGDDIRNSFLIFPQDFIYWRDNQMNTDNRD